MGRFLRAACIVACMLCAPTLALTQPVNTGAVCVDKVGPQIKTLLANFPNGGPELRAAIARAVEANPYLADEVVAAARKANANQKAAIGAGLADAANYFAKCGRDSCRGLESHIRTAMNCADEGTRVGFVFAESPTLVQGIPGFNNAGASTSHTISPSKP